MSGDDQGALSSMTPDDLMQVLERSMSHGEIESSLAKKYSRDRIDPVLQEICRHIRSRSVAEFLLLHLVGKAEATASKPLKMVVDEHRQLSAVRMEIARTSARLAKLLDEEERLRNLTFLRGDFERDLEGLIADAAEAAGRLDASLPVSPLPQVVERTWWPSLRELAARLSIDRERPLEGHLDSPTSVALNGSRKRLAEYDLTRVLDDVVRITLEQGHLPKDVAPPNWRLSVNALAALIDCALDREIGEDTDDKVRRARLPQK